MSIAQVGQGFPGCGAHTTVGGCSVILGRLQRNSFQMNSLYTVFI